MGNLCCKQSKVDPDQIQNLQNQGMLQWHMLHFQLSHLSQFGQNHLGTFEHFFEQVIGIFYCAII